MKEHEMVTETTEQSIIDRDIDFLMQEETPKETQIDENDFSLTDLIK